MPIISQPSLLDMVFHDRFLVVLLCFVMIVIIMVICGVILHIFDAIKKTKAISNIKINPGKRHD